VSGRVAGPDPQTDARPRILIIAAAAVQLLLAAGAAVISVLIGQSCSDGGGATDTPSQVAQRDIPASFLRIYEQVGAQYRIPWEILAGIGKEECDQGRDPDASCTSQSPRQMRINASREPTQAQF
jgi:hypothetical protein